MDWTKVREEGECWVWSGYLNPEGYGGGDGRQHRRAYEEMVGPIPVGLTLDHLCRNRACLRPDHLDPVPIRINVQRGSKATRTSCGNGHPYTEASTYQRSTGGRQCRVCNLEAAIRYKERRKVA